MERRPGSCCWNNGAKEAMKDRGQWSPVTEMCASIMSSWQTLPVFILVLPAAAAAVTGQISSSDKSAVSCPVCEAGSKHHPCQCSSTTGKMGTAGLRLIAYCLWLILWLKHRECILNVRSKSHMPNVTLWWLHGWASPALQHSQGRKCSNMKFDQHEPVDSPELQVLWDQRSNLISKIKSKVSRQLLMPGLGKASPHTSSKRPGGCILHCLKPRWHHRWHFCGT